MLKEKVRIIIKHRSELHVNDPIAEVYLEILVDVLSKNEDATIAFINSCDLETIEWLSEIFDDLSISMQSKKLIECLWDIDKKYPSLNLTSFIKDAEDCLK